MQDPWSLPIVGGNNARAVVRDVLPNVASILRSRWSGATPPPDPVEGQPWWDTGIKRCWDFNGAHWVLPPTGDGYRGAVPYMSSSDPNNDTVIPAGECCSDDGYTGMILPALTKRLDALFTAGNDGGGLDTGTKAPNTLYYLRPIMRLDTRVVDYVWSADPSGPTMPANYTKKGEVMHVVLTDGSGNIRPYDAYLLAGGGIEVIWRTRIPNLVDQLIPATGTLVTTSAPAIAGTEVLLVASAYDSAAASAQLVITSPNETDVAVSRTAGNEDVRATATNVVDTQNVVRRVDSSRRVRARSAQATTYGTISSRGFRLPRAA